MCHGCGLGFKGLCKTFRVNNFSKEQKSVIMKQTTNQKYNNTLTLHISAIDVHVELLKSAHHIILDDVYKADLYAVEENSHIFSFYLNFEQHKPAI